MVWQGILKVYWWIPLRSQTSWDHVLIRRYSANAGSLLLVLVLCWVGGKGVLVHYGFLQLCVVHVIIPPLFWVCRHAGQGSLLQIPDFIKRNIGWFTLMTQSLEFRSEGLTYGWHPCQEILIEIQSCQFLLLHGCQDMLPVLVWEQLDNDSPQLVPVPGSFPVIVFDMNFCQTKLGKDLMTKSPIMFPFLTFFFVKSIAPDIVTARLVLCVIYLDIQFVHTTLYHWFTLYSTFLNFLNASASFAAVVTVSLFFMVSNSFWVKTVLSFSETSSFF